MNLKQLQQQIENNAMANFYIVTGEEETLLSHAKSMFKGLVDQEDRDMNYSQIDLTEQTLDVVINDAMSVPFFGDRRVVVVKNPQFLTATGKVGDRDQELLLKLFDQPVLQNIVVFFANDLKLDKRKKLAKVLLKTAENISLPALNERQAQQAIVQQLDHRSYAIEPEALHELMQRTNAQYTDMKNELPKLITYAEQTKKITLDVVSALVPKTLTANAFDLVDAVIKRRPQEALTLYHDLLQNGEAPLRLNAVLTNQFRLLLQVAGLSGNDQDIGAQLKVHPYRVKLAKEALRSYPPQFVRTGYLGMIDIETQLKSTSQDPELLFERFILKNFQ
ncbi:DNA polymerase III subunit delta [Leuconostoc mesenteroides]|uniref:DNA polymerase III subunit delta n=1 Tax=Leuconostoc mesenteroides TaxID=1245 RepID=UPI0023611322|nr:DNA polymerase III subunit delta [Leuconostoc mesenteroides]